MSCDPCKITVNPETHGFAVDFDRGGFPLDFKVAGFVLCAETYGSIIETCQVLPISTAQEAEIVPELITSGISATAGTTDIIIAFSEELDPACSFENGVTITVDGSPVNIVTVTAVGDSDPWSYTYEVDVTLDFGEAIVWTYDASAGDLCAISGTTLGDSTESTTAVCSVAFPPSSLVTWLPGLNTPTVDGAKYSSALLDVTVSDSTASIINTILTSTVQVYAEFQVLNPGTATGTSQQFFGWKRQALVNNATTTQSVCCSYNENLAVWRVNRDMLSQNQFTFDVQEAAPSACTTVGVALDALNLKCYVIINGNWQTSNGGTVGGNPSGGNGWTITNANQIAVLWSGTTYQNATNAARNPQYTPSGYTEVT